MEGSLLSHNSACTPGSLGPGSHFDSGTLVTHVTACISKPIRMTGKQTTHGAPTNFPSCIGFIPEVAQGQGPILLQCCTNRRETTHKINGVAARSFSHLSIEKLQIKRWWAENWQCCHGRNEKKAPKCCMKQQT